MRTSWRGQDARNRGDDVDESQATVAERLDARPRWRRCRPRARCRPAPPRCGPARRPGRRRRRGGRTPTCRGGSSRRRGPASGTRSGHARPSAIGIIIVGGLACRIVEPSTNSTIEWTSLRGVDDDVDPVEGDVEEQVRLDHLEALVDQRGRVDGDHRAHRPGGVLQRLLDGDVGEVLAGAAAERVRRTR